MNTPSNVPAIPNPDARPFRAVLDTNILVGYALLGAEVPRRSLAIQGSVEAVRSRGAAFVSDATLAELREVLMRPDFDRYRPAEERAAFLAAFTAEARRVEPTPVERLCRDPDDDMFLAVALAADADWLVTVDRQLLSVRKVGRTRILRPERFLEASAQPIACPLA